MEIDPIVHEFAVKHFDLQENNPPVLTDAVKYTADLVKEGSHSFDYIVHDVFTGGADPVDLFTLEFLQGLSDLLKPNGVAAIVRFYPPSKMTRAALLTNILFQNYAGDFALPTPRLIVRTILEVFPTCRFFRESPPNADSEGDFTNMVFFCRKSKDPITFRTPIWEDYLNSRARQVFLEPKHEVQLADLLGEESSVLLRQNNTGMVEEWQMISAAGHWAVMRTVLPAQVWNWW